ncbi:MAG: hypothetical protein AAGA72_06290 [Pseudomonadota bacterium]
MEIDYEAVCIVFGLGLLFGVLGLIGSLNVEQFLMRGGFGAFLGFAALPYFDSEKWPARPLTCAVIAGGVAIALAIAREQSFMTVIIFGGIGLTFGFLSPFFAKHL